MEEPAKRFEFFRLLSPLESLGGAAIKEMSTFSSVHKIPAGQKWPSWLVSGPFFVVSGECLVSIAGNGGRGEPVLSFGMGAFMRLGEKGWEAGAWSRRSRMSRAGETERPEASDVLKPKKSVWAGDSEKLSGKSIFRQKGSLKDGERLESLSRTRASNTIGRLERLKEFSIGRLQISDSPIDASVPRNFEASDFSIRSVQNCVVLFLDELVFSRLALYDAEELESKLVAGKQPLLSLAKKSKIVKNQQTISENKIFFKIQAKNPHRQFPMKDLGYRIEPPQGTHKAKRGPLGLPMLDVKRVENIKRSLAKLQTQMNKQMKAVGILA